MKYDSPSLIILSDLLLLPLFKEEKYTVNGMTHRKKTAMVVFSFTIKLLVNKSTQKAQISTKVARYPYSGRIPNFESQLDDPYHPKHLINCSLYHCRPILEISFKSAQFVE